MSRKRTKQYLMLLMVIGLVSMAAGGGGTFASFSAETTNAGNYFATGTLVLNDNGGTNTCTSAGDLTGPNTNNTAATNDCDTLFTVNKFTFGRTALTSGTVDNTTVGAVTTISAITGSAIYKFDTLTLTKANGAYSDTVVASAYSAAGSTSITADWSTIAGGHSYTTGDSITDNSETTFANLTLTNSGTIDAKNILFKAGNGCTSQYTEPHTTLNQTTTAGTTTGTSLTITSTGTARFLAGDTLVVSKSGHANTFIVSSQTNATTVVVTAAQVWNFTSTATQAVVSGPEFNGLTSQDLCSHLTFSIIETSAGFNQNLSGAAGCAYDSTNNTNPVAANACDFTAAPLLANVPASFTPLSIATASGSNTSGELDHGKSRTFLLAVHYDGVSPFDNTYQNTEAAAFDLTWHIDQV